MNMARRRSYPQPRLPYTGIHEFDLRGRSVTGDDGKERFLVHHILRVDITLEHTVGLASPGGHANTEATQAGQVRSTRLPDADARRSRLDSSSAAGVGKATARLPALPSQFSSTRPVRVSTPVTVTGQAKQAGGPIISPPTPVGTFTTDPGNQSDSRARRGTLAVSTPDRAAPIQADFTTIRRVISLLAGKGCYTMERPSPATFPGSAEPALIVEVERQGSRSYLVERERIGGRSSGPLIVASLQGCRHASDDELEALLKLRSGSRTWPQSDPAGLWRLARVNHAYTSDETFRDAILKRLCSR
ncbi:hypothetical protein ACTQ9L_15375 [Deinococcus wulumuqiensis]